ncbi:AAA family ATPase [Streptomyces sp. SS7]|uniref:helix-turn-helix transcriptional regulator n=1 Tax=Streptomyces sp. SS7 TaxID=3108485 RepID=UPI0030EB25ED
MSGPLRERGDAHALLVAEIERARAGAGRLVLLRGATGTGRSALLEAAVAHAAGRGLRVLRARCSPGDTAVPFSCVLHLLGPVPEFAGEEVGPGEDDRGSAARLWRLLRSYAAAGPVMVAVDDVDLADDASRRWLMEAARRVDRLPLLLVATERSQYDIDPPPTGITHALTPSLVRTRTLAPLADDTSAELVRAAFPQASPRWAADCAAAAAGSPLLLHALLDDLAGAPSATPLPHTCAALYPGSYPAAVSWWLESAGEATAEVARTLAALEQTEDDATADHAPGGDTPAPPPARPHPADTPLRPDWPPGHHAPAAPGLPDWPREPGPAPDPSLPTWPAEHGLTADLGGPGWADASGRGGDPGGVGWFPGPRSAADLGGPGRADASGRGGDPGGVGWPAVPRSGAEPSRPGRPAGAGPTADLEGAGWSSASLSAADVGGPGWPAEAGSGGDVNRPGRPDEGRLGGGAGLVVDPSRPGWSGGARPGAGLRVPGGGFRGPGGDPRAGSLPRETAAGLAALLAEVCAADPARVSGWLTAMTRLGLLRPGADGRPRYAHPLLRDAVLAGWPAGRRQDAHRAVAQAMLRRGDGVESVARQLLDAARVDEPWALRVLRDAVTVAVRAGRTDDAVGYLRRALAEPLPDDLRQRLLTELGSLEYASADAPVGIPRLVEALDLPAEPRDRVRTAIALGTALAGRGEVRTAVQVLRRTEALLPGHPELTRALQTASALLSDQDQTVRQDAYRWLAQTANRSPELVGASGQALLVRYAATAGDLGAREAMRRVRTLLEEPSDPLAEPFLLGTAAAVAQWADELDEAQRLVERGLASQRPSLLHPMEQALLDTRYDIAAARGDYRAVLAGHRRAARARRSGIPGNADAHALTALVETGRTAEARALADSFDLRDAPDSWELNRFLHARGVLRFTEGDVAGALHDFLECGRRQSARAVLSPVVTPWRTAAAECRLALGNPQEALALAEEELRLARVWNTPRTVGRALRVLGRATGGRRGLELGDEAVAVLRDSPAEAELVASLLAQGFQLTASGERTRGRDHLREAAERAERLGSARLLAHANQALRTAGARRTTPAHTGSGSLTGSERRIAELAVEGRTNMEIAAHLHVARRTVETHLTSAYRKLGIRRRGELRAALER